MSIRSVCRSTLAAEANAIIEATESCDYLTSVVTVLLHPDMALPDVANNMEGIKTTWYTDAKSLYDLITKDTSRPADKWLRIVVAQLREMVIETNVAVQWIDTQLMLAEALTKVEAEKLYLLTAIKDNYWNNTPTTETLAAKERIRAGRKARHDKKKLKENTLDIKQEENGDYEAYFCEAYHVAVEVTRIGEASNPGPRDDRRNTPSRSPHEGDEQNRRPPGEGERNRLSYYVHEKNLPNDQYQY